MGMNGMNGGNSASSDIRNAAGTSRVGVGKG